MTFGIVDQLYKLRFLIEVFFKFCKQNLLLNNFSTPECNHEENWSELGILAYLQAYLCRNQALKIFHPWEYNRRKDREGRVASLTEVQRSFPQILKINKIKINKPIKRGTSPGRKKGTVLKKRIKSKIIKKNKSELNKKIVKENTSVQPGLFDFENEEKYQIEKTSIIPDNGLFNQHKKINTVFENNYICPKSKVIPEQKKDCKSSRGPP